MFFFNETTGVTSNEGGLIFKSGMTNLVKVNRDMRQFLGESFNLYDEITMMEDCEATEAPGIPITPGIIPRPGGVFPPVVVFNKKREESPLTIALIVIISIAILVVLVLLIRSWRSVRSKDLFDRPGEKDDDDQMPHSDLAPVMQQGGFLNSTFHNTVL